MKKNEFLHENMVKATFSNFQTHLQKIISMYNQLFEIFLQKERKFSDGQTGPRFDRTINFIFLSYNLRLNTYFCHFILCDMI